MTISIKIAVLLISVPVLGTQRHDFSSKNLPIASTQYTAICKPNGKCVYNPMQKPAISLAKLKSWKSMQTQNHCKQTNVTSKRTSRLTKNSHLQAWSHKLTAQNVLTLKPCLTVFSNATQRAEVSVKKGWMRRGVYYSEQRDWLHLNFPHRKTNDWLEQVRTWFIYICMSPSIQSVHGCGLLRPNFSRETVHE